MCIKIVCYCYTKTSNYLCVSIVINYYKKLQKKIKENFGEMPRKYLKEYQDIDNKQEISGEEKQEKLSKLLISIEIEKNLYKKSKI